MKYALWITVLLLFNFSLAAAPHPLGHSLTGKYRLTYLSSEISVQFRDNEEYHPQAEFLNLEHDLELLVSDPIQVIHAPKNATMEILGAGKNTSRLCKSTQELFFQDFVCGAVAPEAWNDESTQCQIKKTTVERLTWHVIEGLRYHHTEVVLFNPATWAECEEYKSQVMTLLDENKAPAFIRALKVANLLKGKNDIGDVIRITHSYQTTGMSSLGPSGFQNFR
jgi:hypothetical protein